MRQAGVDEVGLSILIQDIEGVSQHLFLPPLACKVPRGPRRRPEVERHGNLPKRRSVGAPENQDEQSLFSYSRPA